MGNGADWEVQ